MRFYVDFSAEENGLLLVAIEELIAFKEHSMYAHCFIAYEKAGIDVAQTLQILKSKAEFMLNLQNGASLESAIKQLTNEETPSV